MRIGRTAIVGAVIAATTAGTMLVAAPSALAAPGNCTISYPGGSTVTSVCTSGTGHQQIDVVMYRDGDRRAGGRGQLGRGRAGLHR